MFETITGHDNIKGYLKTAIKKGAIGQSLLFAGSDADTMGQFALEFATATLSHSGAHHPDLHLYHPEGKLGMHTIESMRKLSEEVYLSPFEGERKVFILYEAERMLPTSSNALLKTFEEPAEDTLIILISTQPENILPTIRSRCRVVRFSGERAVGGIAEIPELSEVFYAMLTTLRFGTYKELTAHTERIGSLFDGYKTKRAKLLRDQMTSEFSAKVSMVQADAIEKESEGVVAMECAVIVKKLFEIIVYWYRDLEVLNGLGSADQIFHRQHLDALRLQQTIELNQVVKYLSDAQLAYQRSTSLSLVLENLFLKLNKV